MPCSTPLVRLAAKKLTLALAATVAVAFWLPAGLAAQDFSKVEVTSTELAPGLFMLQGSGGNIGLSIGPDGVFMIDDQYAPLTEKIKAAIAKLTPQPVKFVINTHWHFDHTGGNENFGKDAAIIVAHDNVRTRLAKGQYFKLFDLKVDPAPHAALPVITFSDSLTFHLNGDELDVYHLPKAHTDGDSVVRFRNANVLHGGDLLFYGFYPVLDLESGGSVDGMIAAVQTLYDQVDDATKIIPGHGPVINKAQLGDYLAMLRGVRANVAALVAAGKTREEAIAAKPTAAFDEKWGKGFIKPDVYVGVVYDGLKTP